MTTLKFTPLKGAKKTTINREAKWTLSLGQGTYRFEASFNYPKLEQLSSQAVLNPDRTTSLSFLSYKANMLGGTWPFLMYVSRDSLLSLLLIQSILSQDAIETVIGSVLERVDRKDGTVCHEEVLGDYATYLNKKDGGIKSNAPRCDYKMVDTDIPAPDRYAAILCLHNRRQRSLRQILRYGRNLLGGKQRHEVRSTCAAHGGENHEDCCTLRCQADERESDILPRGSIHGQLERHGQWTWRWPCLLQRQRCARPRWPVCNRRPG
jgi:hypothetical protein